MLILWKLVYVHVLEQWINTTKGQFERKIKFLKFKASPILQIPLIYDFEKRNIKPINEYLYFGGNVNHSLCFKWNITHTLNSYKCTYENHCKITVFRFVFLPPPSGHRTFTGHRRHQHHRADTTDALAEIRFVGRRGGRQEGVPPARPFQGHNQRRGDRVLRRTQGKTRRIRRRYFNCRGGGNRVHGVRTIIYI